MIDRLREIEARYEELAREMSTPEAATDPAQLQRLGRELARLEPVVNAVRAWNAVRAELEATQAMARDPEEEVRAMAREELISLEAREAEIQIPDKGLRVDVYRSSGPGGQSVNTTDSAVRITHLPTGIMVAIQDEKSQHKNKAKALAVLRARLLAMEQARMAEQRGDQRRAQLGTGERAEKIRTYNFPDDRVTDHRIGLTVHNLPGLLEGDLDRVVDPLAAADQARRLSELGPDAGPWRGGAYHRGTRRRHP